MTWTIVTRYILSVVDRRSRLIFLPSLNTQILKKEFLQCFFEEMRKSEYGNIFGEKLFYCSVDNDCIRIQRNTDGEVQVDDIHE